MDLVDGLSPLQNWKLLAYDDAIAYFTGVLGFRLRAVVTDFGLARDNKVLEGVPASARLDLLWMLHGLQASPHASKGALERFAKRAPANGGSRPRVRARPSADREGANHGDAGLHVSGAGTWRPRRPPLRYLVLGSGVLRDAHRTACRQFLRNLAGRGRSSTAVGWRLARPVRRGIFRGLEINRIERYPSVDALLVDLGEAKSSGGRAPGRDGSGSSSLPRLLPGSFSFYFPACCDSPIDVAACRAGALDSLREGSNRMQSLSLALVALILLPHGPAWAGYCAMAEAAAEETHACARGGKSHCPHHAREHEPSSADCHSKPSDTKPELTLGCGCGSHGSQPIAASVLDRLGPIQALIQFPPSVDSRAMILDRPAFPPDPLIELITPPPRITT